jgi:hypothetical protein
LLPFSLLNSDLGLGRLENLCCECMPMALGSAVVGVSTVVTSSISETLVGTFAGIAGATELLLIKVLGLLLVVFLGNESETIERFVARGAAF